MAQKHFLAHNAPIMPGFQPMITYPNARGFTLLELLIALAVMALVLGMGVPAYKNMIANSQSTAAANDLMMMAQNARAQALRTRTRVVMCPSVDGQRCSGSDWSNAISGLDANRNDTIDGNETILRRVSLPQGIIVEAISETPLIFMPDGTARMGSSGDDGIDDPDAILVCTQNSSTAARWIRVGFSSAQTQVLRGSPDDCS